jgi:hypothetical protein
VKTTTKVDPYPISVGTPTVSFSRDSYLKVVEAKRQEAREKKTVLVTRDGIEDYRSGTMVFHKGGINDALKMCTVEIPLDPQLIARMNARDEYLKGK